MVGLVGLEPTTKGLWVHKKAVENVAGFLLLGIDVIFLHDGYMTGHKQNLPESTSQQVFVLLVPGAGIEPAWAQCSRDFKSLVSTNSTTRAIDFNQ